MSDDTLHDFTKSPFGKAFISTVKAGADASEIPGLGLIVDLFFVGMPGGQPKPVTKDQLDQALESLKLELTNDLHNWTKAYLDHQLEERSLNRHLNLIKGAQDFLYDYRKDMISVPGFSVLPTGNKPIPPRKIP